MDTIKVRSIKGLISKIRSLTGERYSLEKHPTLPGIQFLSPVAIYFDFSVFVELCVNQHSVSIRLEKCEITLFRNIQQVSFFVYG